jgi:hypothetical protein
LRDFRHQFRSGGLLGDLRLGNLRLGGLRRMRRRWRLRRIEAESADERTQRQRANAGSE